MIVADAQKKVVIANANEASEYGIELGSKFYEIMEGGIYKDKIGAIIRELSSNALDSHVMAQKADVPFEVHLPTSFDSTFFIRDYGVGLTDDEVRGKENGIYTTYFKSTKTNSNEQIGAWGLGSKTPFSYVDNFVVTSWKNGFKSTYNMCVDSNRKRQVVPLALNLQSDEPSGLLVKFAVKNNDFHFFYSKAAEILRWFKTPPKMVGHNPEMEIPEYIIKTNRYGVLKDHQKANNNFVLVGNIVYSLPADYYNKGIVYFANIGDVDVTTSREEIKDSTKTSQWLNQAKSHFTADIGKQVQQLLQNCTLTGLARKQFIFKVRGGSESWLYRHCTENYKIPVTTDIELYKYSHYYRRSYKDRTYEMLPHANIKVVINDTNEDNWSKITKKLKVTGINEQLYYAHKYTDKWLTDNDLNGVTVKLSSIVSPKTPRVSQKGIPKKFYFYKMNYLHKGIERCEVDRKNPPTNFTSILVMQGLGKVIWLGQPIKIVELISILSELRQLGYEKDVDNIVFCSESMVKYFGKLPDFSGILKTKLNDLQPIVDKYNKYKKSNGVLSINEKITIDKLLAGLPPKCKFAEICDQAIMPIDLSKINLYNKLQMLFGDSKNSVSIDHANLLDKLREQYPLLRTTNVPNWSYFSKEYIQYIKLMDGV